SPCAPRPRARRARRPGGLRSGVVLGSPFVLETFAKLVHREPHAAFYRAQRRVGARRDLALRVAAPEREREDLALLARQLSDDGAHMFGAKRIDDALVDLRIGQELRGRIDRHLALETLAAGAAPIDCRVAADGEQPRAHRPTLLTVRPRLPPNGMERILSHLFGGLGSREHPIKNPKSHPAVAVVELAERIGVAGRDPLEEFHIVRLIGHYDLGARSG